MDRILTLREAEEDRFRSILECMPQAVLLFDTEFHPVHVNPAARILLEQFGLGDSAEPVRMLNGLDLTAMAEQALENGGSSDSELRLPLGETWNVTASPVGAEPGRTDGWVFVFTDLTESRRLQDQLAQAEKMSSLGQMISGVAHELNNPLASIIGYAQLLQAAPPDSRAELAGRLEIMDQEARRCQKIVRNLLSFARRRDPEKKLFSLNDLVQSVQSLMRYQLRMDDVEIVPDTDLELPLLYGDAHLIQQVLLNLVTNSHHALKEKGEGGRIWVRTVKAGEDILLLEVEDDGPGIPPAIRSRIFDPFFTTKGPGEGTGLGLSLVYGTVTSHGGTVECRESDRGGVCFRIRLPRAEPDDGGTEKKEQDLSASPPDRARVLVVDDEQVVADLMKAMLQQEGHQVVTAASGREALDLLARETFSMVIIDYRMPGISGVRLCEEIRAKMGDTPLPMLMTSGDTISGEPEQVAARVGVPLLHKPFNMDEFHGAVRRRLHEQASGKL
jgi:two-component system NtrC family sensor kinase